MNEDFINKLKIKRVAVKEFGNHYYEDYTKIGNNNYTQTFAFGTSVVAYSDLDYAKCRGVGEDITLALKSGNTLYMSFEEYFIHGGIGCPQLLVNTINENFRMWKENQVKDLK